MLKFILISVLTHCLLSLTMARQQTDDHFNIPFSNHYYGCLDKKNVTVLVEIEKPDYLYEISNLLSYLDNEQPCYSLNVYLFNARKFVPWDDSVGYLVQSDFPKKRHEKETREIIGSLQRQHSTDTTTNQILLFFRDHRGDDLAILEKLQNLDAQPNWNVIFVCDPILCTSGVNPPFPINRVVPSPFLKPDLLPVRNHLKSLIDNPDFDRFELVKHFKPVEDQRWNCLENTTIKFDGGTLFTLKIMEHVMLLLQNTQDLNTHVRYFHEREIWSYFKSYYKLHRLQQTIVHHDSTVICLSVNLPSKDCAQSFTGKKRSIVYVDADLNGKDILKLYRNWSDKFNSFVVKKHDIKENLLEDILEVACS